MRPEVGRAVAGPARVLVAGSGGREHALAWRLARDPGVELVIVAPGNAGMRDVARLEPDLDLNDHEAVGQLALREHIDLVVIGPEAPLVAGLADHLRGLGLTVFGPGREGSRLEGSKHFCRQVAEAAGVPMAEGKAFEHDEEGAIAFARALGAPVVIKADGLAAGKGVTVCDTLAEAGSSILACRRRFGQAGARIVVERALQGREASVICLTDGSTVLALPAARDHKRVGDGDTGPNTGGMGAYSPVHDLPDQAAGELAVRFHRPILDALAARGIDYRGALYAGLMLTADGPYLLECNVRFGDPETQVLLPRVTTPLAPLLRAAASGALAGIAGDAGLGGRVPGSDAAVGVVLAAQGYPDRPRLGHPVAVRAWPAGDRSLLFWSGVQRGLDGRLATNGGRVATVVGQAPGLDAAADAAYAATDNISFTGRHLRRDIGRTGLPDANENGASPVGSGAR